MDLHHGAYFELQLLLYSRYLESENGKMFRNEMRKKCDRKLYIKYFICLVVVALKSKFAFSKFT